MSTTIELSVEGEAACAAQAAAESLGIEAWLKKLANQYAAKQLASMRANNLAVLLLHPPFAGSELDFKRIRDLPRPPEAVLLFAG